VNTIRGEHCIIVFRKIWWFLIFLVKFKFPVFVNKRITVNWMYSKRRYFKCKDYVTLKQDDTKMVWIKTIGTKLHFESLLELIQRWTIFWTRFFNKSINENCFYFFSNTRNGCFSFRSESGTDCLGICKVSDRFLSYY